MEKDDVVEIILLDEEDLLVGNRRAFKTGGMNERKDDCLATAAGRKSISQDSSRRQKFNCGKCGKLGHNRVTCGRAAFRFCLPTRICEKCGKPGHHSILCTESSASAMIPTGSDVRKDDPEMGSLGSWYRGTK
ncbi:hypothetical protein BS78_05G126400 [Paspalum vaginatum]|nr:hypothetical protein BS78_05G126400 [Paspalum vaginatum]